MSGLIQLAAGIAARNEAKRQASFQEEEARIAARNEIKENEKSISAAKVAFLSSGLALSGTPMAFLGEQERIGKSNVENVLRSGFQGAERTRAGGRTALMSGVSGFLSQAESVATGGMSGGTGSSGGGSLPTPTVNPKPQPIKRRL